MRRRSLLERGSRGRGAILLVGNWASDTGYAWKMIEKFWSAIATGCPGRRTILCYPRIRGVPRVVSEAGIECEEFAFDLSKPLKLARFCRQRDVAAVYLTDRPYVSLAYAFIRLAGVRRILMHQHTPGERSRPRGLRRALKWLLARLPVAADMYIACSPAIFRRFLEVGCLPASRCRLAENGIDLARFQSPVDIRGELGLPRDALLVVSSSRATRYKGVHRVIEAAALLQRHLYFLHCGDGPALAEFRTLVEQKDLQGRFFLLGHREDVAGILMACDVAVHASEGEVGMSLSILEAMAAGLPVVVADQPTVCQAIEDGVTGLHYRSDSVPDLAQKIRRLAGDPELRQLLGGAARREVRRYDLARTIDDLLRAVHATLSPS